MPDEAQPAPVPAEQGQGPEGTDGGLYDSILEGVPEQFHGQLTEKLKAKDADFTKRFQSQAETWKPYEELGIRDVDPEQLGESFRFWDALQAAADGDEEASGSIREWWSEVGDRLGFSESQSPEPGEGGSDILDLSPEQLEQMVGSQVAKTVNPLVERLEQQEQQRLQQEAATEVSDQLASLRKEHPNLSDEDEQYILGFAWQFGQDAEDPIAAGFEKFKALVARGENDLFEQKLGQPAPAEGAGRPNTSPPEIDTFQQAQEAAKQRLAAL